MCPKEDGHAWRHQHCSINQHHVIINVCATLEFDQDIDDIMQTPFLEKYMLRNDAMQAAAVQFEVICQAEQTSSVQNRGYIYAHWGSWHQIIC